VTVSHHAIPGRRPVAEAVRAGRPLEEVVLASEDGSLGDLAAAARAGGVAVRLAGRRELDALAGDVLHQGAVAVAPPFSYAGLEAFGGARSIVALDGINDPQNLGAIARSAEALGAGGLVLPRRRSAHVTPAAEKAAAGAFSWLPVAIVPNLARALHDLASLGLWSVGLDGDAPETVWECRLLDGPVVLVVGAEGRGLSRLVSQRVDARAAIPQRGQIGSLNAAAATALALGEIARRNVR
jgi:23S rRNA (guanosine2251-2'-O)-methyltransferase